MMELAVFVLATAAAGCVVVGLCLMRQNRQAHAMILAALDGLGRTHLQGFEALTIELDRLKQRVAELEKVVCGSVKPDA